MHTTGIEDDSNETTKETGYKKILQKKQYTCNIIIFNISCSMCVFRICTYVLFSTINSRSEGKCNS